MPIQRLQKYVNLALNNSSEGEARSAASRFFKTLKSLDMRFNSREFGLTKDQALQLADLGGVVLKGVTPTKTAPAKPAKKSKSVKAICFSYFERTDMNCSKARRATIDVLVMAYGLDKRSVQSYASNYRRKNTFN